MATPLIKPICQGSALLKDVQHRSEQTDRFHLWWLGQSGFLLGWKQHFLLFDPYLSDSLTKKYAATDKPHVRMTEQVVLPEAHDFVQVVTSSHQHTDHLDGETLRPLVKANPSIQMVVPHAHLELASQRVGKPASWFHSMDAGSNLQIDPFRLHALPSAHECIERDEQGRHLFLGYVVEFGPWRVYHSGDTLVYDGLADQLKQWAIDAAILPINGRGPERRVAGNMWGDEAARLASEAGVGCVIPCHYEMFAFNTQSPAQFITTCQQLGQGHAVLRAGGCWSSPMQH